MCESMRFFLHEAWPGLILWWLVAYLPTALVFCVPVWWFGRGRVKWSKLDLLLLVVPYFLWASLLVSNARGKSWGNLSEGAALGIVVGIVAAIRVILANRVNPQVLTLVGLAVASTVGGLLWGFVPLMAPR